MTYSIVARDPDSGELGVAVQSHFFSVGSICPWAEPGVGAVATQSMAEPSYGPLGLARMRDGTGAPDALSSLLADDEGRESRQVAFVDSAGRVAVHTGSGCIAEAGDLTGEGWSVQVNMMRGSGVPEAMAEAFTGTSGDLASRLLAALVAAEGAGGDVRGKQSACLVVVAATGEPWDRMYDVRVDDHVDPLGELARLAALHRAYREGDAVNNELRFWRALALAGEGKDDDAREMLGPVFAEHDGWALLLRRLPGRGLVDEATVDRLLAP